MYDFTQYGLPISILFTDLTEDLILSTVCVSEDKVLNIFSLVDLELKFISPWSSHPRTSNIQIQRRFVNIIEFKKK